MLKKLFCNHNYQLVDRVEHYLCELDKLPYKTYKNLYV